MKYLRNIVVFVILFCIILAITIIASYNYLSGKQLSASLSDKAKASPAKLYKRKKEKTFDPTPVVIEENEIVIQNNIVFYKKNNVLFKIPPAFNLENIKYKYSEDESGEIIPRRNMKKIGFLQKNNSTGFYDLFNEKQGELAVYSHIDNIYLDGKFLLKYEKIR